MKLPSLLIFSFLILSVSPWAVPPSPAHAASQHFGVDIASPEGAPIRACETGVVASVKPYMRGESQITIINRYGAAWIYVYVKPQVTAGQQVLVGDVIGVTDGSGRGVRNTLHLAYRYRGGEEFADPLKILPERNQP